MPDLVDLGEEGVARAHASMDLAALTLDVAWEQRRREPGEERSAGGRWATTGPSVQCDGGGQRGVSAPSLVGSGATRPEVTILGGAWPGAGR